MASPFPGMDPYLEVERLWPAFQHQFVGAVFHMLMPGLSERYQASLGERRYETQESVSAPGVWTEHREEFIEIRGQGDGRLVTLVEVVSPANKTTSSGLQAYLEKRRAGKNAGANLVEIDLVLQGQPTLEYSRDGLPDWDYAVTVTRASHPERFEIYTATLQKRLPRFRLPLAAADRDMVVDLHAAFMRCYDQGDFAARIDYQRDPAVGLSDEDRRWVADQLKQQKLRQPCPG